MDSSRLQNKDPSAARVYIHLARGLDARNYKRRYEQGLEPDESPYGFHLASDLGLTVTFSRDHGSRFGRLFGRISRYFLGFDFVHAWQNRFAMREADVIWTMTEGDAMGAAALMTLGLISPRPLIASTVWVINAWYDLGLIKRRIFSHLSSYFSVLTTHSLPCLDRAKQVLPRVDSQILYFGIPDMTFSSERNLPQSKPIHVVAVGNDRTRDWKTVLDAFGDQIGFKLTIICQWFTEEEAAQYSNVSAPRSPDIHSVLKLYRSATYLAVPMHENIFSGITVANESASMEIPLLCSRTGGVPTYFSEDEVLYLPVGDSAAWRNEVTRQTSSEREAMARRAKAKFKLQDYSTRGMINRYAEFTRDILGRKI